MVTLCCALMVHVRARPVDLGNLVFDAPNRLDVTDLFMQRCGRRQRSWTSGRIGKNAHFPPIPGLLFPQYI